MKSLKDQILENLETEEQIEERKRDPKYVIRYQVKGEGHDYIFCDDWEKEIRKPPISKAKYWDVMLMSVPSLNDPEGLVAWSGEGGFWANRYERATNLPRYSTMGDRIKTGELKKIEQTKQ